MKSWSERASLVVFGAGDYADVVRTGTVDEVGQEGKGNEEKMAEAECREMQEVAPIAEWRERRGDWVPHAGLDHRR